MLRAFWGERGLPERAPYILHGRLALSVFSKRASESRKRPVHSLVAVSNDASQLGCGRVEAKGQTDLRARVPISNADIRRRRSSLTSGGGTGGGCK